MVGSSRRGLTCARVLTTSVAYLLDTNICVYVIRGRRQEVLARFARHALTDLMVSSVTAAELYFGIEKGDYREANLTVLDTFLAPLIMAPFDGAAARVYGSIRVDLERRGLPIGPLDTLIAAHALSLDAVLVTNNVREFTRVPGLRLENWADA